MLDGDRIIPYVIIGTHGLEITLDAETLRQWGRNFAGTRCTAVASPRVQG